MNSVLAKPYLLRASRRLSGMGAAVIAATIVTAGVTIWDLHDDAGRDYQSDMTNLGVLIAEQTSRSLQSVNLVLNETRQKIVESDVTNPASFEGRMGTESVHRFLQLELKGLPQAEALIMIDAAGRVINYSRQWPVQPINVSDRDFFSYLRDHDDAQPFSSTPVKAHATQERTFYISERVNDPQGNFLGVVEAAISPSYWAGSYSSITVEKGTVVSFVRRDGVILARYPKLDAVSAERIPSQSLWYKEIAEGGGTYRSKPWTDGLVRVVNVRPVDEFPLVINVSFTEQAVLAHWRFQTLCIVIGALVVALGFAVLFSALAEQFKRLEGQASALAGSADALRDAKEDAEDGETASRAKSLFLANMSHELRTPLNAVIGFSQLMRDAVLGPLDSRYQDYANDIHGSGAYLLRLINDILDTSKIDAGQMHLDQDRIDLVELVGECERLLLDRAHDGGVSVAYEIGRSLPLIVGDRLRIKQVLLNLLVNAIKFTPAGGTVRLSAVASQQQGVSIVIADNGIGMEPASTARALEPFQQLDNSLARRYEGTGLGLPLAKSLVELHGGKLTIESDLGKGTRVHVWLPPERLLDEYPAAPAAGHRLSG